MSAVHVDLLGTQGLRVGATAVGIRGQRQRTILAMLALAPDRVVSVDTLIEAVWADSPPASARTQVAICVASLRKALAAGGADRTVLGTEVPGYRLRIPAEQTDVGRFTALRSRAAATADDGDVAAAAALLDQALGLWRGTALGELSSHLLEVEAARLEELRLGAVEQWAQWCLDLRRESEVLPALATIVENHPLRERAQATLMHAQYRCGLRAEALATFRTARRVSVDETGLEPGPLPQRMHDAILADDPCLGVEPDPVTTAPPGPEPDPGTTPAQLPVGPIGFGGRARELALLDDMLDGHDASRGGSPVAYLTGAPGIGKTATAVHWASRVADRFPDGRIVVDLEGPDPAGSGDPVEHCLLSLGIARDDVPPERERRLSLYRGLVADRRVLLVIDGARDARQVVELLPTGSGSLAVVTGRDVLYDVLGGYCSAHVPLGPLGPGDAVEMLAGIAGRDRVSAEAGQALRLVELCDRLPLVLRNVGARLAARPRLSLAQLVDRVADESRRLDELSTAEHDLRRLFARACDSLTTSEATLLRRLGDQRRDPVSVCECADLLQASVVHAEQAMERLVDRSLAEPTGSPLPGTADGTSYRIGGLVRTWIRETGTPPVAV